MAYLMNKQILEFVNFDRENAESLSVCILNILGENFINQSKKVVVISV